MTDVLRCPLLRGQARGQRGQATWRWRQRWGLGAARSWERQEGPSPRGFVGSTLSSDSWPPEEERINSRCSSPSSAAFATPALGS